MMHLRGILLALWLGLITCAGYLLYFRPENARFHLGSWYPLLLNSVPFGVIIGSVLIAVFATHLRIIGIISSVMLICAFIIVHIADQLWGSSMGSYGWIVAFLCQSIAVPAAAIASLLAGSVSLIRLLQFHSPDRIPIIAAFMVIVAGLFGFTYMINRPPDIERLLQTLKSADAAKQLETIHLLRDLKDARIIEPIIALLHNPDEPFYLRSAAAWTLGNQGGESRIIQALIAASREQDRNIREAAIFSLGQASQNIITEQELQQAIETLAHALTDPEELVRIAAVQSIGWLNDKHAMRLLINALSDESSLVRYHAHEALVHLSGQDFGENTGQWKTWHQESQ
ncbi:alpha-Rep4 [Candidatus Vecturithrix granuli]|uniref:Alpha-Rep4 n=1 Tax=Vecturithrix granuli TaxID=1499967 RepID=A0A081BTQ3_VECG1|nr:alpha-Rep4 [Candidatus Vecturithrix granuli]